MMGKQFMLNQKGPRKVVGEQLFEMKLFCSHNNIDMNQIQRVDHQHEAFFCIL
jgi:hypothetical protein